MTLPAVARRDEHDVGGMRNPAYDAAAVTPADNTLLPGGVARGLYVGVAGNVAVVTAGGTTVTFVAVPAGSVLPLRVQSVNATNTTAGSIVALY